MASTSQKRNNSAPKAGPDLGRPARKTESLLLQSLYIRGNLLGIRRVCALVRFNVWGFRKATTSKDLHNVILAQRRARQFGTDLALALSSMTTCALRLIDRSAI